MAKEEIVKYDVRIEWDDYITSMIGVDGFKLEEEVYYFFKEVGIDEHPWISTVWIKHPQLKTLTISPYMEEVKKGKK